MWKRKKIFAVVTVYDTPELLPHFIEHYRALGVDRVLVASNVDGVDCDLRVNYGSFSNQDKWRGEEKMLARAGAAVDDWVLHLDLDEFHEYPASLPDIVAMMERDRIDAVTGNFLDHIAASGELAPIAPSPSLFEQFPAAGRLTEYMVGGKTRKVMIAKRTVQLTYGRHGVADGTKLNRHPIGTAKDYIVHHFRWTANLIPRLEGRWNDRNARRDYPARNLSFVQNYRAAGRIDLSAPVLEVRTCPAANIHPPSTLGANPYSIDDSDSAAIEDFVAGNPVQSVLEFGPGRSTLVWDHLGCDVDAIEDDDAYFQATTEAFQPFENIRVVKSAAELPAEKRYDLAFVDGPKGTNYSTCSRIDSVTTALQRASVVLLHDSKRRKERQTVKHFEDLGHTTFHLDTNQGIAVIYPKVP